MTTQALVVGAGGGGVTAGTLAIGKGRGAVTARAPAGPGRLASGCRDRWRSHLPRASIVFLLILLAVAGCLRPEPTPPAATCTAQDGPQEPAAAPLAGDSIMAWADQIVELPNGFLRPRVPSDAEHACTADWLEQAITVDGWRVVRSDFSGEDYLDLPKGSVQSYIDGGSCREEDRQEVPDMMLTNLAAVWFGPEGGQQQDRRTLLLAAHWDAKEDDDEGGGPVPAANDGASGMAVLLGLQRHIAAQGISFPFDVAIAFFDAEDGFADCHPLAGSIHFAQTMPIDVDRLILLDMVGDPDARFPREGHSVNSDPALVDLIWSKADEHGLGENFVDERKTVSDDHVPFIEVGVPAVDIIDFARPSGEGRFGFPPYWHLPDDTLDNLSGDFMASIAALVLDVMQDPAFTQQWPERA